ncbi:MAG: ABC transporter permease [Chitinophagaceae bacterium]|nr:ABC transporter permease [Chitinophagaceae bacterium]
MRTLKFLLQKEFRQIFRNRSLLPMLFALPVIQLLVLPLAADYEVKNINIAVIDHDRSGCSRQLIQTITASGYFKLASYSPSFPVAMADIEKDKADLALEIPAHFEKALVTEHEGQLFLAVNAINGTKAALGGAYLAQIIAAYNNELRLKWISPQRFPPQPGIALVANNRFNPFLNYRFFMVPGILVLLVTMIGAYMCALNIVKEKEAGTIEQINVTPVKKFHFILGKLIPFWVIGIIIFTIGLFGVGRLVYGIVPQGSILLLYSFLGLYLVAVLGLGLLISTYAATQQQAMSVAFFFMMIFLLMSGLFTSVDSMPAWAQLLAGINPVTYFIDVMRMVVLKGSGFRDVQKHFLATGAFAVLINCWAVFNYRKTA